MTDITKTHSYNPTAGEPQKQRIAIVTIKSFENKTILIFKQD